MLVEIRRKDLKFLYHKKIGCLQIDSRFFLDPNWVINIKLI